MDCEHEYFAFYGPANADYISRSGNIMLKNLKILNTFATPNLSMSISAALGLTYDTKIENVTIENLTAPYKPIFLTIDAKRITAENVSLKANVVDVFNRPLSINCREKADLNRISIDNCGSGITACFMEPGNNTLTMSNILIKNCHNNQLRPNRNLGSVIQIKGIYMPEEANVHKVNIVNSTIYNNSAFSGMINTTDNLELNIYNSIMFGNTQNKLILEGGNSTGSAHVSHSLFENGENDIINMNYELSTVNILSGDPLFIGTGEIPENLASNSPCVNTGTVNIPGFIMPETDLAGNPRIVGSSIDMGCYEYQGVNIVDNDIPVKPEELNCYPNPFNPSTTISFNLCEKTKVSVDIYNIKGQLVKKLVNTLLEAGSHQYQWDGKNEDNHNLSSGIYFVSLKKGDKNLTTKRIVLVK
jgi:hypothetical protein